MQLMQHQQMQEVQELQHGQQLMHCLYPHTQGHHQTESDDMYVVMLQMVSSVDMIANPTHLSYSAKASFCWGQCDRAIQQHQQLLLLQLHQLHQLHQDTRHHHMLLMLQLMLLMQMQSPSQMGVPGTPYPPHALPQLLR